MKKLFASLVVLFSVSVAGAVCDDLEFGSQAWWDCMANIRTPMKVSPLNSCDALEFGSPDWWDCMANIRGGQ